MAKVGELWKFLIVIVVIPFIPLILLIVLVVGAIWVINSLWLGLWVRWRWYPRGKRLVFVYSNSPNWKEYIEVNVLSKIREQAVVVNWSERSQWNRWRKPLEIQIFEHWSTKGGVVKEFNPMAVVFIPWWRPKIFRFWQPFKDYKHGKETTLKQLETRLFEVLRVA